MTTYRCNIVSFTPHILLALGLAFGSTALADLPPVPSGQNLEVFEEAFQIITPAKRQFYLGILAPEIKRGGTVGVEAAIADIDVLCEAYALQGSQRPADGLGAASEVVIRLMDRPITYGETNSDVRQYMGFYDVSQGQCKWH